MIVPVPSSSKNILSRGRELVLVVDDDAIITEIISMHLDGSFEVLTASNGAEGYEIAVKELPDLILSDIRMHVKGGIELCRDVRSNPKIQDVPIVMLTATKDQESKIECLAAGATEFISKPCSATELKLRVRNLVQMYRQQLDLAAHKKRLEDAIQELQRKEELLVRQEKLTSLGRMSAALIHEINNPLNYALQGLCFLKDTEKVIPPDQLAEYSDTLSDVRDGVTRVSRIINELKDFANPAERGSYEPSELSTLVNTAIRSVSAERKSVEMIVNEVPDGFHVLAHTNLMVKVLAHLIKNGLDAIGEKTYAGGEEPSLSLRAREGNGFTRLIVHDNGVGMTPEIRARIFDPFFTTKEIGHGLGLGLSTCHAFLNEFGGSIEVQSSPGEFTELTLDFPSYAHPGG